MTDWRPLGGCWNRYFTSLLDTIGDLDSTTVGAREVEQALHVDTQTIAEKMLGFREEPTRFVCRSVSFVVRDRCARALGLPSCRDDATRR